MGAMLQRDRARRLEWLKPEQIYKNKKNPRQAASFAPDQLIELQRSIEEHGILQPLIVTPYDRPADSSDEQIYELLDGERRWTVSRISGLKQIPCLVVKNLGDYDQVLFMFHSHHQHESWKMYEELQAIQDLRRRNAQKDADTLARELGMSRATLNGRLKVLELDDEYLRKIGAGKIDYTAALRIREVGPILKRERPRLVSALGGEKAVERKLLKKAEVRRGVGPELVDIKRDLADPKSIPDKAVRDYVDRPEASKRDLRGTSGEDKRRLEAVSDKVRRVTGEIKSVLRMDLDQVGDIAGLRRQLSGLMDAAQDLELRIVQAERRRSVPSPN